MNTEGSCIASNHDSPAMGREPGQHREPGDQPTSLLYVVFGALNTPEQDHSAWAEGSEQAAVSAWQNTGCAKVGESF